MAKKRKAFFPQFAEDPADLGRQFMESPTKFAKKMGMSPEDLNCPPEAHQALKRGEDFAAKAAESKLKPDDPSMAKLDLMAKASFGEDYAVELIPFGLRFREKASLATDITGTAAGTVTWLDTDAGVDS